VSARERIRGLLTRLAELETGRLGSGNVRFSRLEQPPRPRQQPAVDTSVLARLSPRQREIAGLLAAGWDVRRIAEHLGTSRSNVYAGRKRIAHHLGVPAEEVADEARRLGLSAPGRGLRLRATGSAGQLRVEAGGVALRCRDEVGDLVAGLGGPVLRAGDPDEPLDRACERERRHGLDQDGVRAGPVREPPVLLTVGEDHRRDVVPALELCPGAQA
jgi:DNA-binding CsgD family transcriptional regulator